MWNSAILLLPVLKNIPDCMLLSNAGFQSCSYDTWNGTVYRDFLTEGKENPGTGSRTVSDLDLVAHIVFSKRYSSYHGAGNRDSTLF
jgi:hypothetical protein